MRHKERVMNLPKVAPVMLEGGLEPQYGGLVGSKETCFEAFVVRSHGFVGIGDGCRVLI